MKNTKKRTKELCNIGKNNDNNSSNYSDTYNNDYNNTHPYINNDGNNKKRYAIIMALARTTKKQQQ